MYSTAEGTKLTFQMFKMYTVHFHFEIQAYKNTVRTPHLQVRNYVLLQREHAFNKLLPHKGTAHLKRPVYYLQFLCRFYIKHIL